MLMNKIERWEDPVAGGVGLGEFIIELVLSRE